MENIIKSYGGRSRPIWISQKISIDIWDISVICSGEISLRMAMESREIVEKVLVCKFNS